MLSLFKAAGIAEKMGRTGRGVDGWPGCRYEMTDNGYERIKDLLTAQRRSGRWAERRTLLNSIFWFLNNCAYLCDMPKCYSKWMTVYGQFRRWTHKGLTDRIRERLHASLDEEGRIDWSAFDIDGSNVRSHLRVAFAARYQCGDPS